MPRWSDEQIEKLIADYLAGEISDSQKAELEAVLLADPDRLRDFGECLLIEDELRRGLVDCREEGSPGLASVDGSRDATSPSTGTRSTGVVWAIAALILALVTLAVWKTNEPQDLADNQAEQLQEEGIEAPSSPNRLVAYLGRFDQCQWEHEQFTEGDHLSVGSRLALAAGKADVIFENGARVTIKGPCELSVDDAQACSLRLGDASVYVPESAFGFKMVTPSGIVVDLGTSFGVTVDDQGSSEVHVFEGEVAFQALDAKGRHRLDLIRLPAARACQIGIGGTSLREFEANEAKFKWRVRAPLASSEVPDLPVLDDLTLWLAADRFVDVDEANRVISWRDLLVGSNSSAEDALQIKPAHRPLLKKNGINGMPAVRFGKGGSFLLTPPLATTNEQTAFAVLSLEKIGHGFQQILNYNGPPQRVVGALGGFVKPAVFEICLRDRDHDGKYAVCGEVFTGFTRGRSEVVKKVVAVPNLLQEGDCVVVVLRYSLRDQQMTLFVDGQEKKSQKAEWPIAITSRKILGRHPILGTRKGHFSGCLGEVVVYNRALPDDEVLSISNYLMERFNIAE